MNSGEERRKNAAEAVAALVKSWRAGLAVLGLDLGSGNFACPAGRLVDFIASGQARPPAGFVPSVRRELDDLAREIALPDEFFPILVRTLFSAAVVLAEETFGADLRREADLIRLESEVVVEGGRAERGPARAPAAAGGMAYRNLVENLPAVIWRARSDGRLDYVSPNIEKILGILPGQCLGGDRFARVHPDDREWARESFANLFSRGTPFDIRYRLMGADGDWLWVHDRASGVYEDEEGPLVDGVFWDITELKNIEDELEEYRNWLEDLVDERTEDLLLANKQLKGEIRRRRRMEGELMELAASLKRSNEELDHFARVVSHDLKEPLVLICAFGEKLRRGYEVVLDERGRDYLARIIKSGRRLQRFIDGLLALARVSTGKVDFVALSLKPLLEEVVGDLEEMITPCGGMIEVDVDQSLVGDRLQLYQLFQNIIANAIKYRREGVAPRIKIEATALDNDFCEIRISDNGIGFEEKETERIFLPFERLQTTGADGTGIGLATCERIVKRHGGEITARSIPGHGTTFIVRLPMSAD